MGLQLITPPATEPVSRAEAKAQCVVDVGFTADDALFDIYIAAARSSAEKYTGTGIMPQSWTLTVPQFPQCGEFIELPRGPVVSIDSITYLDQAGATQTLDPSLYVWERSQLSDRISLAANQVWPSTLRQADAVSIAFTVGFVADITANPLVPLVPTDLKAALLMRVADLYRNREAQLVGGGGLASSENSAFHNLLDGFVRTSLA